MMQIPHESWPTAQRGQERSSASVVLASSFSALTIVYGLALFHPPLVRAIDSAWSNWSAHPGWALAIVALGSIVSAGSLALITLAKLTRGMQRSPFAWSAPLLVIVSALIMFQLQTHAAAGLSLPIFVAGATLVTLGGGSLLRIRSVGTRLCGILLLAAPTISVIVHAAVGPGGVSLAWAAAGRAELLFGVVLVATSLSMTLLSLATPGTTVGHAGAESAHALRERVIETDRKLAQARRRAKLAERAIDVFDRPAPGRLQPFLIASVLLLVALLAGAYFSIHVPLLERARFQQKMLQDSAAAQRVALEAARQQWASERSSLQLLLAQEQSRTSALVAEDRALRDAAVVPSTPSSASRTANLHARPTRVRHGQTPGR